MMMAATLPALTARTRCEVDVPDDPESSGSMLGQGVVYFGEPARDGSITVLLLPNTSIDESMVMVMGTDGSSQ
jgi:hypothetical protein